MIRNSRRVGRDYLRSLSRLSADRLAMSPLPDTLILCGDSHRASVVNAVIRSAAGYEPSVRSVSSLGECLDRIVAQRTGLIVIDDVVQRQEWSPKGLALTALPVLRRFGYDGAVIVVASIAKSDVASLRREGASDIIDRDQFNAVCWGEMVNRVLVGPVVGALG